MDKKNIHSTAKRLYKAAEKLRGVKGQSNVAKLLGASPQTVKNWEDRGVSKEGMINAQRIIGCRIEWIKDGSSPMSGTPVVAPGYDEGHPDAVLIKKVKIRLTAGICGFEVSQVAEDGNPIYFRKNWMIAHGLKPENLIAITIRGDSMAPGLYEGDTVVINTADTEPRDGKVFAVNYDGEDLMKRLVKDAGAWWLYSDNPDHRKHPRKECAGEYCIIIGRAVHKQSERI